MRKIILASASPRRSELMKQAGLDFDVCVSTKEEKKGPWDVAERYAEDCIIVGADTVVSCDQEILGKPANDQDAFRMLHMLQGRTHEVYTGVTVIEGSADVRKETVFAEKTEVTMYPMTDKMIWDYIRTGEPADKAGAYGIQGRAAVFIRSIHGDYNNVVGLPVAALWQYLNSGKEENDATL